MSGFNSEALRIANLLETEKLNFKTCDKAAAELRRLHAVNCDLLEALKRINSIRWGYDGDCGAVAIADEAINKAEAA
jgi:hypothetical protein